MRTITKNIYSFDELDDRAKERARDWYREGGISYDWWDACYEEFIRVADILGINFNQRRVTLMGGGVRYEPAVYFTGFYTQGSGSSFNGTYRYAKGTVAKIKAYAPQDLELNRIACALQEVQRCHFYKLGAKVESRRDNSITVEVWHEDDTYRNLGSAEDEIKDLMNDFNDWMFSTLEQEYEYLMSDEAVEESIRCNEYEFDENGRVV